MKQQVMEYGQCVKWAGAYGFINPEIGGTDGDLYVRFQDIEAEGFRQLKVGQRVMFRRVTNGDRGERAVNVRIVEKDGNR